MISHLRFSASATKAYEAVKLACTRSQYPRNNAQLEQEGWNDREGRNYKGEYGGQKRQKPEEGPKNLRERRKKGQQRQQGHDRGGKPRQEGYDGQNSEKTGHDCRYQRQNCKHGNDDT